MTAITDSARDLHDLADQAIVERLARTAHLERINTACVRAASYSIGLPHIDGDGPDCAFLQSISLADMLAAAAHTQSANAASAAATGTRTVSVFCDDRFLAALYTTLHHDPTEPDGAVTPVFSLPAYRGHHGTNRPRHLCLVLDPAKRRR